MPLHVILAAAAVAAALPLLWWSLASARTAPSRAVARNLSGRAPMDLREVILEQGGSLSHHHGVGKIRRPFIPRSHSPSAIEAVGAVKRTLDPNNVFAAGNNIFGCVEVAKADDLGEAVKTDVGERS